VIYCYFVFYQPNFFIEADNYIPANPLKTPAHIVPEWYFLPFYAILRSIPDLVGGVIAFAISVLIFAVLPYLDRSKIPGGARYRPFYRILFYVFVVDIVTLGYVGSQPPEGLLVATGQVATFIYFGLFILLPIISKKEEVWLRAKGLPKEVEELIQAEEAQKAERERVKKGRGRRKDD
ncbi:MAG: cytochrome b/b6, partial [Gammaproteobacteria bacterium]|nr:cytochrome b/b6 [Gammaproteobacteria bacterium]